MATSSGVVMGDINPGSFDAYAGLFPNGSMPKAGAFAIPGQYNYGAAPSPNGITPGAVGVPQPYRDFENVYPNLTGTNAAVSSNILNQLHGQLSPETINNIQDAAARFGISSGMPGSGLSRNRIGRDIGTTTQALQQQGIQNYNQTIPTVFGSQVVNPAVQAQIATTNAANSVRGNEASHAQSLYDQYLRQSNPQKANNYEAPQYDPFNISGGGGNRNAGVIGGFGGGGFGGGGGGGLAPNMNPNGNFQVTGAYGTAGNGLNAPNPLVGNTPWTPQQAVPGSRYDPLFDNVPDYGGGNWDFWGD